MRILSGGIVRARDDSCNNAAEGRRGARGGGAGRVRAPAGRPCLLRQILDELVPGVEQFLFVDDVVAVEDGAGLVAGQEHGDALGDAGADQVAGGGAGRCCMNTLWGWGRASWASCGPDVRRGGHPEIDADMGYSADKSPLIGHLAGPIRRLKPLGAQRQEKCGPNHLTREGLHATTPCRGRAGSPGAGWPAGRRRLRAARTLTHADGRSAVPPGP